MSSLIQQTQAPALAGAAAVQRNASSDAVAAAGQIAKTEEAAPVSIDTTPSAPPPEVLAEVQDAAASWQALQAKGYEVHYSQAPGSRGTTAELRNSQGVLVRRLTASEAVALAAGEQLGEG